MGFRNKLTSASAVDTRTGTAAPGVQVYNRQQPWGSQGVVEFDDGISGDTAATILAGPNYNKQGTGYAPAGGSMSMKAGTWSGVAGPELDLNVEPNPAGGYMSVARVKGADQFYVGSDPVDHGGPWTADVESSTFSWAIPVNTWTTLPGCSFTITPPSGRQLAIEWKTGRLVIGPSSDVQIRLNINGGLYDSQEFQNQQGLSFVLPARLTADVATDGSTFTCSVDAYANTSSCSIAAGGGGYLWLQHRIR